MYLPHHSKRIMFVSDSTGWTNAGKNYPSIVTESVRSNIGHVTHINKGIGGTDSKKLTMIWDQLVARCHFDLLVLNVGLNDAVRIEDSPGAGTYHRKIAVADFRANMEKILAKIKFSHPKADIIFCTSPIPHSVDYTTYIDDYRAETIDLVGDYNTAHSGDTSLSYCDFSAVASLIPSPTQTWDTSRAASMVYLKQFKESIIGNPTIVDKGDWNASTNSPSLASGVGTAGDYYRISVSDASRTIDGQTGWTKENGIVFNTASKWQKVTLDLLHPIQAGQNILATKLFGAVQSTSFYTRASNL